MHFPLQTTPSPWLRRLELLGIVLVGLTAIVSALAVNIFPAIGTDSVVYIEHSLDLVGGGLVVEGFRQVGYPAFLAVVEGRRPRRDRAAAAVALVPRGLLVGASGPAFWVWRWCRSLS